MTTFIEKNGFSVVSLIIPQSYLNPCLEQILTLQPYKAIHFDCRGTITREHWFQALLPVMNPECEYLQFLVSDRDLDNFVQTCIEINQLHLPGSGAIFTTRCNHFSTNFDSNLIRENSETTNAATEARPVIKLKHGLSAIYALIQSGRTEKAIKAAMQAGSHGPIVYFVEGRGTRDRIGWLKITKKPYEEVVMVIVEDIDREKVKDALVSAGRVNTLGGGIVYEIPIEQGLINLPTSISNKSRIATNEQITVAIDQLMGNTNWRDTRSIDSLFEKNKESADQSSTNTSVALYALLPRKHSEDFLEYLLSIGIPGANVNYTKLFSGDDAQNELHLKFHHELVQIRMVLPSDQCPDFRKQLQGFADKEQYKSVTFYELDVKGVVRYQIKSRDTKKTAVYRGVSSSQ